jgi:hypothetical protein
VYFLLVSSCISTRNPALARGYREMADKVADLAISGAGSGRAAPSIQSVYNSKTPALFDDRILPLGGNSIGLFLSHFSSPAPLNGRCLSI